MANRDLPGIIACHRGGCCNECAAIFRSLNYIAFVIAVSAQAIEIDRDFVVWIVCAARGMTDCDLPIIATRYNY